ncbi:hypothetical protein N7488_011660 [Penicillium malachiteum]|nr:hypothetical protein N7488_011660 [Penicillium malachiteum]
MSFAAVLYQLRLSLILSRFISVALAADACFRSIGPWSGILYLGAAAVIAGVVTGFAMRRVVVGDLLTWGEGFFVTETVVEVCGGAAVDLRGAFGDYANGPLFLEWYDMATALCKSLTKPTPQAVDGNY